MRIHAIEIEGFRGIRRGKVTLGDFTVLIGPNNSGKTTVIEALALLFGRDRLVRSLTEHDFHGSNPKAPDRIKLVATISGFSPNDPERHPDWFRHGRAVPKWLNPADSKIYAQQQGEGDLLVCQVAFEARFDHASLDVESIRYFVDDEAATDPFADDASVTQIPLSLVKDLGFFLVPASRTWDRMISFGSELFRRAVTYVGGKPAEAVLEERDRLRNPASPLEDDEKMKALVEAVNKDILSLFGRKTELKLRLTATDSDSVLESVIPHFAEGEQIPLPSRRHGSGLISLQTLILLMRFGALRTANDENFLMCIEEPELHIPPPQQRRLLHLMQKHASQTIVTTHSPTVAAVPSPHQLVLLVNNSGELTARPLLPGPMPLNATSPQRGLFLSDRDATVTAIMNPAVLIPEGKTDAAWLRLFGRIADISAANNGPASFTHEIGVIPTKDARIADVFDDLQSVHPMLTCLVDGDTQGKTYATSLSNKREPPTRVISWPDEWTMEHVVGWIVAADETVLQDPELQPFGVPQSAGELAAFLSQQANKGDEVLHGIIADAISQKPRCCTRVTHVLTVLASIAMGRPVAPEIAVPSTRPNGHTTIWTFNDDVPGV
ncbi:ATP-dependent endonuclease [Hyphomonas sp. CY54-11-8]|uniref:ATP-dependent nuclease n=1 Tax=Hyphomonas sp. CY54-11-8 TaxID=1280944 RepID=UPI000459155D|nr:AAA family ATPase [Hyphomonas sp. CY54-11-8]KCZ48464.1 hypothetical protein HY17_16570 [Hyphomonas sp. CY54-11-8]